MSTVPNPINCAPGHWYMFETNDGQSDLSWNVGDTMVLQWGAYNKNINLTLYGPSETVVQQIIVNETFAFNNPKYLLTQPSENCTLMNYNWTIQDDFYIKYSSWSFGVFNGDFERNEGGNLLSGWVEWSPTFNIAPAVTNSTTTSPFTPSASPSSASSGLSSGAIAGIAIGAIAGVALLLALGFIMFRRRRSQSPECERQSLAHSNESEKRSKSPQRLDAERPEEPLWDEGVRQSQSPQALDVEWPQELQTKREPIEVSAEVRAAELG